MIRYDFDRAFVVMVEALGMKGKVPRAQVDLFFEEFGHHHSADFLAACKELGMGNIGYLPKLAIFRESVAQARERRLDTEKAQRDREAGRMQRVGPPSNVSLSPGEALFSACCAQLSMHVMLGQSASKRQAALEFIATALQDPEMNEYCDTWRTLNGEHPILWLNGLLEARKVAA